MEKRPIYLDCHSTTPMDPQVLEAMIPYFVEHFGNSGSINHLYGWEAAAAIKIARQTIAESIQARPAEIIFTSGATEANNLALKGVAESYFSQGRHIITVVTEHRAILDPASYLQSLGFQVTLLPVQSDGLIDLEELEKEIRTDTILVSVMAANNEIGVIQPLAEIGEICRRHQVIFHSDAAQALGKIPLNVEKMNLDLVSLTAHKVYGPKGIGALYVRGRNPLIHLSPQIQGGGQERGLRAGTLYTPQIVGFAKAVSLAMDELETESQRLIQLREQLEDKLRQLEGIHLNGHRTQRLPGNLNVSIEGVDGQALQLALAPVVALSSGSACSTTARTPSHVLKALGHADSLAYASLRFGLGRFNTLEEIEQVGDRLIVTVDSLRRALG